jgi:NADPH:quinone reductase-like Zn-dependent oxidoreductase
LPKTVYLSTGKRGVDVVVDNVGTTFNLRMHTLDKGVRLLTVSSTAGAKFEIDNRYFFTKHLSIIGSTMSRLKDFKALMDLVVAGILDAVLDKTFELEEAGLAQERLYKDEQFGKTTFAIG